MASIASSIPAPALAHSVAQCRGRRSTQNSNALNSSVSAQSGTQRGPNVSAPKAVGNSVASSQTSPSTPIGVNFQNAGVQQFHATPSSHQQTNNFLSMATTQNSGGPLGDLHFPVACYLGRVRV